jgi:cytochrome P450
MMLNPAAQKFAQEELDSVCPDRLPEFEDQASLIRIECILRETLRIHPTTPQGIPHRLDEEDTFEGMRIPKGAAVIPNVWFVL